MFRSNHRIRLDVRITRGLVVAATYLAPFAVALSITAFLLHAQESASTTSERESAWDEKMSKELNSSGKPFFSLASNRTYSTSDRARLWLNYRNINQIDFRVYRVKDPVKFFRQLDDPHQVGEDEKQELQTAYHQNPTLLEKTHALKTWIYSSVKDYVRAQLQRESRKAFNQKFRADVVASRVPLNVADYARVPLLNPDQLVSAWREKLPPLSTEYDRRLIPLGKREPGVYLVEAVSGDLRAYSVAIVTDLMLVQKTTPNDEVLVYAVDRKTGAPRAGVAVEVVQGKETLASGKTDDQGILKTSINQSLEGEQANDTATPEAENGVATNDSFLIMASAQENFAISDLDSFYFNNGEEEFADASRGVKGYIYTDRPVYRPQQTVYFKGILRRLVNNSYQMIGSETVNVTVEDDEGGKLFERDLPLSSRGTFSGEVEIGDEAPLGYYRVIARVGETDVAGSFEVEEYKKPEFKVKVSTPKNFVQVGGTTKFAIEARYFFGAPVRDAEVQYYIYRSRYYPEWWPAEELQDEFDADPTYDEGDDGYYYGGEMIDEGAGATDAKGRMEIAFDVPEPDEKDAWDYIYRIEAQVTDSSRRMMPGQASFIGTRGLTVAYAGAEHYVYTQGDVARIRIRTSNYEGRATAAQVTLKFFERRWEKVLRKTEYGEYDDYEVRERELSSADATTNAQGEATYDYLVNIPGNISIKTEVTEGGKTVSYGGGSFWVSDSQNQWSDSNYENDGSIELVPDKKSYQPGETARVLVMLPTERVHLLVTTELASVMTAREVEAVGRTVVLDVPIAANYAPNVYVSVAYVKNDDLYTGNQNLNVPARDKVLKLEIIPNKKEYKPRETASYTILARNPDGSPAPNAEVSLGVVDEAIYSVTPERAGDIRREFYGHRYNEVQTNFTVSYSFIGYAGDKPIQLASNKPSYQLADFKNESEPNDPAVRRKFKDTAFWQPDVVTNADGRATVKVELPDNLTTWRATARGVTADTRVGVSVDKVVARKDLIIRIEAPRFLTVGDTVTISGIVHNFTKSGKQTRVSLDVTGAQLLDAATETDTIASQGEKRVDWRVNASQAGQLKLLARALTDLESDAVEIPLEIVPRGLKQTKAASAALSETDSEQSFSLDLPGEADPNARKLRIEAAPSVASTLFGALDYLTGFPYGCTEQTMSRFLPSVIVAQAVKDVPGASVRASNNLDAKVRSGLDRLYSFQHADGGWGWWKTDESDPFMTAYVVDGLSIARNAGYPVEDARLARARERLQGMLDLNEGENNQPLDLERRAYMIYALNESGEADARFAEDLFANRNDLQPYGRALLALTLHARGDDARALEVANEIAASASVDERGTHWESRRSHIGFEFPEVNSIEATALSLKALARVAPQSELLPKAARWLVRNRRFGHYWNSTKETAFAVFGLTDYLRVSQELSPDYMLEVYLNGEQIGARHVTADDVAAAQSFVIERKGRAVRGANRLRVVKRGRGVLYFSATLDYFTGSDSVAAQSSPQLKLTREYLRLVVDESGAKPVWKVEPLTGELKSGDLVVVRLHLEGARAEYLMIEDPIPAGCEQVARVSDLTLNYSMRDWGDWYSAREFRDQKTVFFLNYFDGKATFQYAMRVEVPGEFRIAPARAELMYQPSVQSNTSDGRMTILEK